MAGLLTKWILRSKLRTAEQSAAKAFLPWDKINSIALIIAATPGFNKSAVDRFISETKKFVEVFYIEPAAKQPSFGDWFCLSRKDRSVFNLPKSEVEAQLKKKKFDVVINTSPEDDLFSADVLRVLSAPLKCAAGSLLQDANLIVTRPDEGGLLAYLNETKKYLQMIRVA